MRSDAARVQALPAQQITPAHVEIFQIKHRVELIIVFSHAPVAGLAESKFLLDNPKQVLHFGTDTGLGLFHKFLIIRFIELLEYR